MIIALLVVGFFGYGIYGSVQEEIRDEKTGLQCETNDIAKCRGFSKKNGFKSQQPDFSDDDFDDITDDDFVMYKKPVERKPAIVIDRRPAVVEKKKK